MRARGKVLLLLLVAVTAPLAGLSFLAGGLLEQVAAAGLRAGDGDAVAAVVAEVAAAQGLLWLAALALAAAALGPALLLSRRMLVGRIERLQRLARDEASAGEVAHEEAGDELAAVEARLRALQTAVRRGEQERLGSLDAVRVALDRAEAQLVAAQRLGMTGRLALGAAHEIGGPLSIAVAAVDSARAGAEPGEMLDAIDASLGRVDGILRELSRFGRPDPTAGDETVDVHALAATALRLAQLHPKARSVGLHLEPAPTPPALVRLSRRHLEQVALNLILNAADATSNSGHILVTVRGDDDEVQLVVDDDGPGVPEHLRERVFEPFFTSKTPEQGSGLGLAISRRLVAAAGGRLELGTSPLLGARLVVTLPRAGARAGAAEAASGERAR